MATQPNFDPTSTVAQREQNLTHAVTDHMTRNERLKNEWRQAVINWNRWASAGSIPWGYSEPVPPELTYVDETLYRQLWDRNQNMQDVGAAFIKYRYQPVPTDPLPIADKRPGQSLNPPEDKSGWDNPFGPPSVVTPKPAPAPAPSPAAGQTQLDLLIAAVTQAVISGKAVDPSVLKAIELLIAMKK